MGHPAFAVDPENRSRVFIEPFEPGHHERAEFSCGVARLDNFLRFSARKRQKDDFTRVFVAVAEGISRILGYYALNTHAVGIAELGRFRPARAPNRTSLPSLYLSMIAVDEREQGKPYDACSPRSAGRNAVRPAYAFGGSSERA